LDSHLKTFIPPLVAAYLELLHLNSPRKRKKGVIPLSHAICQILNLFCKVRGEKVIKGFLNNEPRYLEPMLDEFENGKNLVQADGEALPQSIVPWTERYVLLLWLSHLMLAPFPLASMSALQSSQETSAILGVDLRGEIPVITLRVLDICLKGLHSATKERGAAAQLLVTLCVRPDMQKLGLLEGLVSWSLTFFNKISEELETIHQCLGVLSFLSSLVTSASKEEIGPFLPEIYQLCQNIISQDSLLFVRSSAVARKLVVKTLRNIVVHYLQTASTPTSLDTTSVLEEVIEFLLEALADGDTPVRFAASKALSIITMKLEPEMAGDVVEAILGSLNENVYWQGSRRILSGVNPLRWHGLTLTLSHLLYRRAVSTTQLPDILNALLLALAFEQRSATGGSIGTSVRDAACFGIWALSRRYATKELLAVETSSVRASEHHKTLSILQVLAIELVVVACLDPAGNIRRGSSAALQELIGRNPNTVEEGIPLVQIVDFHAVGLRDRAMCEVAIKASELRQMYWEALFENLLGWRGTGSLDAQSRLSAAAAVGLLSDKQEANAIPSMAATISRALNALKPREIEERQGLVMSLAELINHTSARWSLQTDFDIERSFAAVQSSLAEAWVLLKGPLHLDEKAFTSPGLRPELTAAAICNLLGALASLSYNGGKTLETDVRDDEIVRLINLCLARHEDSVLEAIPGTSCHVTKTSMNIC
jgi:tubulin-specific chaperone D